MIVLITIMFSAATAVTKTTLTILSAITDIIMKITLMARIVKKKVMSVVMMIKICLVSFLLVHIKNLTDPVIQVFAINTNSQ